MKKFIILLVIGMLLLISFPAMAAETEGFHGEVMGRMGVFGDACTGEIWRIDVYYNFNEKFAIGSAQTTATNGLGESMGFIPSYQLYEVYFKYRPRPDTEIRLCQWCNHSVYSGTDLDNPKVSDGWYLQVSFKW